MPWIDSTVKIITPAIRHLIKAGNDTLQFSCPSDIGYPPSEGHITIAGNQPGHCYRTFLCRYCPEHQQCVQSAAVDGKTPYAANISNCMITPNGIEYLCEKVLKKVGVRHPKKDDLPQLFFMIFQLKNDIQFPLTAQRAAQAAYGIAALHDKPPRHTAVRAHAEKSFRSDCTTHTARVL